MFFDAETELPGVMGHLDRMSKDRNTIMHAKRSADEVDVHGFRDRVIRVCAAWMQTQVRTLS